EAGQWTTRRRSGAKRGVPIARNAGPRKLPARLPAQPRLEAGEVGTTGRDEVGDRLRVDIAEGVELAGMDRAGHEDQVDAELAGADRIGADRVADGDEARLVEFPAGRSFGEAERPVVDRAIGLSGHADLAAAGLVEIAQRA